MENKQFDNNEPKTISQLISDNNLTYPFVVERVSSSSVTHGHMIFGVGTRVVIVKKLPSKFGYYSSSNDVYYEGYFGKDGYAIMDSASWVLAEKSGGNVVSMSGYKKFREAKQIRIRKK